MRRGVLPDGSTPDMRAPKASTHVHTDVHTTPVRLARIPGGTMGDAGRRKITNAWSCNSLRPGGILRSSVDLGGSSSAVERQLPKLDVAGSIPVSRSILSGAYTTAGTGLLHLAPLSADSRVLIASFRTGTA